MTSARTQRGTPRSSVGEEVALEGGHGLLALVAHVALERRLQQRLVPGLLELHSNKAQVSTTELLMAERGRGRWGPTYVDAAIGFEHLNELVSRYEELGRERVPAWW